MTNKLDHNTAVVVTGGRDYTNTDHVCDVLDAYHEKNHIDVLMVGDARGVDSIAFSWAIRNGVFFKLYCADWDIHGTVAGPIRNTKMLLDASKYSSLQVLAFPGGKGTEHCKRTARIMDIDVCECTLNKNENHNSISIGDLFHYLY